MVGDTGVGKTTFAASAPRALFWSFEVEGTESARVAGSTADEIVIKSRAQYEEAFDYMDIGSGCKDYEWLIVDSGSEMEETFWTSHLAAKKKEKPGSRSLYKPFLDDYPYIWNQVKAAVESINQLPINVLYTFQVMQIDSVTPDGEDITELLPAVGSTKHGALARKICGKVSMVGFLTVEAEEEDNELVEWRRMYVSKRDSMHAKNRYGWNGSIDDPTIPQLVTAANKALSRKTEQPARRARRA